MARVLVTDGEQRAALAVVRSLGRAGHEVFVCSTRGRSLAGASRHARGETRTPDPLARPAEFLAGVRAVLDERAIEVLLPISEASLLCILPAAATLRALVPFAEDCAFRRASDKAGLMELARSVGLTVPKQVRLESAAALANLDSGEVRFPLVLKPARSVIEMGAGRAKSAVAQVAGPEALRAALSALPESAYPVLLQERIIGPGAGVFLLLWDGRLVAAFAHQRLREKPPSGGVSVYSASAPLDPELLHLSVRLLDAIAWRGVAMVEYKVDSRTGDRYLMEVNGRFWGSLQLAVDAGVDFPQLLVALALGREARTTTTYREGVRLRWMLGDLDHLIARLRHSAADLALPPGAPGRGRALLDFLAGFGPGNREEIFRFGDARPGLRAAAEWLTGR